MVNQWFPSRKRPARRRKLKDALISAAERTIAAEGLRGLKARELAYKVGCAVGAIYNVVTDLDELIFAVNALTLRRWKKRCTTAGVSRCGARQPDDAIKQLVQLALAYTDFAAAHQPRWRALFEHRLPEGREIPIGTWRTRCGCSSMSRSRCACCCRTRRRSAARCWRARCSRPCTASSLLGLEEKLQIMPLPVLREQVTLMVTAMAKGLAQDGPK